MRIKKFPLRRGGVNRSHNPIATPSAFGTLPKEGQEKTLGAYDSPISVNAAQSFGFSYFSMFASIACRKA